MNTLESATKIWTIAKNDIAGRPFDPENIRGGEVHPDLIRFQDWFYCLFNNGTGKSLIRSPDGENWELVQLGPCGQMFALTPWGDLMTVGTMGFVMGKAGQYKLRENGKRQRDSFTRFSRDGARWSGTYSSASLENCVLYNVTWHKDAAYGVAYDGKDQTGTLYRSEDGHTWRAVKRDFFPDGGYNEGDLAFANDGTAFCLLRGPHSNPVIMGTSNGTDYTQWDWKVPGIDWYGNGKAVTGDQTVIRAPFGGPKFLRLDDGRLLAYGRVLGPEPGPRVGDFGDTNPTDRKGGRRRQKDAGAGGDQGTFKPPAEHASVVLFLVDPHSRILTRFAEFQGYSHYFGVVEHENKLWIACGAADDAYSVMLLKTQLPE